MISISILLNFWMCLTLLALAETNQINLTSNQSRIVGGIDASVGEFPYQGFLIADSGLCGCSLISESWSITAAHCVDGVSSSLIQVYFGSIFSYSGTLRSASGTFVHPSYNSSTFLNDIALIKFTTPITYSSTIAPISLPQNNELVEDNTNCYITGFGATSEGGGSTYILQEAVVPIINNETCATLYALQSTVVITSQYQVCAGYAQGGTDSCQGDSGGPLACPNSSGTQVLHGVTSFGIGCARPLLPGVYTRTSSYIPWIEETTSTNSSGVKQGHVFWVFAFVLILTLKSLLD